MSAAPGAERGEPPPAGGARETGADIEGEGAGGVERAGMDKEALDRLCEGTADGFIHQKASCPLSDDARHEPQKGEFDLVISAEIEFEQAHITSAVMEGVGLHLRIVEDGGKLIIRHHGPAE